MDETLVIEEEYRNRVERISFFRDARMLRNKNNQSQQQNVFGYITYKPTDEMEEAAKELELQDAREVCVLEDVADIFKCSEDKALKIMHLMMRTGYSMKLGKSFVTTKDNIFRVLDENMGKSLAI